MERIRVVICAWVNCARYLWPIYCEQGSSFSALSLSGTVRFVEPPEVSAPQCYLYPTKDKIQINGNQSLKKYASDHSWQIVFLW